MLSRVTLGADVAVTSVLLDAARKRFPSATLVFVGPPKNCELFAGDPRVYCLPFSYGRRSLLKERLSGWEGLRARLDDSSAIILDPDSRLTQLGLLPVCREENYFLFESRAYGGDSNESLPALARRWSRETFGVENASPYICPAGPLEQDPEDIVTVSLGVGGNDEKRMRDPFEAELLKMLADGGRPVLVDKGAGDEETDRVERAVRSLGRAGSSIRTCQGPFAPFAARVARSALYVGYDSSGQHVAAASAVPLVTVFAGYASERTFARWRPSGEGPIEVIRAGRDSSVEQVLNEVGGALNRLACFTPERRIAS